MVGYVHSDVCCLLIGMHPDVCCMTVFGYVFTAVCCLVMFRYVCTDALSGDGCVHADVCCMVVFGYVYLMSVVWWWLGMCTLISSVVMVG